MRLRSGLTAVAGFALLALGVWLLGGARLGGRAGDESDTGGDEMPGRRFGDQPSGTSSRSLAAAPREKAPAAAQDACSIDGVVREGGVPVAARVEARLHEAWRFGARDPQSAHDEDDPAAFAGATPSAVAQAGPDGRFEVVGLAPGQYALIAIGSVSGAGAASAASRGLAYATVAVEGARSSVDVDLEPAGYELEVHATNEDGTTGCHWPRRPVA